MCPALKFSNSKYFFLIFLIFSCQKDIPVVEAFVYNPKYIDLKIPNGFPSPYMSIENLTSEQGVKLGKKLFYDKILSGNNTMSCADCHSQSSSFANNSKFNVGIDGILGNRNAMPLVNLAWSKDFNWNGNTSSLESQAFEPVTNPIELHSLNWENVSEKLMQIEEYKELFHEAFNTRNIDSNLVVNALAQFERTLISGNSKFDKFLDYSASLSASELRGKEIFTTEKGDCFHCHSYPLFTSNDFHNNGIDNEINLKNGRFEVTNNINDKGKFKSPTLRNIELTAPYMHDGRFETLEEVIEHYNFGGHYSSTIDPNMKKVGIGLGLNDQDKLDLLNFLKTLTDTNFINNPVFQP